MFGEGTQSRGKDEAERRGPQGFAELCRGMMPREMQDCCGDQMREMMSRWMTRFHDAQGDPGETEQTEAGS